MLFGSNGVRGVVNIDLTPEVVLRLGRAVGRTFPGTVAVATDARDSADAMKAALMSGIMSSGADVVDLGMLPTPAFQYYLREHDGISGGAMITASHNPSEYSGLKLIVQGGVEAMSEDEHSLESMYSREVQDEDWSDVGEMRSEVGAADEYVDRIVASVDAESIRAAGLTVCIDCANGSASRTTPMILRRLGVKTVSLECDPDGIPRRESDPTPDNLSDLMFMVPHVGADLGVAHDSDGGRAVFIDGNGRYIRGDCAGALVAGEILAERRGKVVTPVSSSRILEDSVESAGGQIRYTEVGTHTVVRKIQENLAVFGVEEDGGMIFPSVQMCRDGGMALAKMLEIVAKGVSLADLVDSLPQYHTVKMRVPCRDDAKDRVMDRFKEKLNEQDIHMDTTDGVKVFYDEGWVLVRPSTTEECIRIYSDSKSEESALSSAEQARAEIESLVSSCSSDLNRGSSREPREPR